MKIYLLDKKSAHKLKPGVLRCISEGITNVQDRLCLEWRIEATQSLLAQEFDRRSACLGCQTASPSC